MPLPKLLATSSKFAPIWASRSPEISAPRSVGIFIISVFIGLSFTFGWVLRG